MRGEKAGALHEPVRFLQREWNAVFEAASKAEAAVHADPRTAGEAVFSKARLINTLGNRAVHSHRSVPEADALTAVRELFHVTYWFARTYARAGRPAPGLAFDARELPRPGGTVIALCDLLMRCNWVKRVLFLADRVALVKQAVNAFKRHLPDASPVNLVTEKEAEGRVFVSTYPTMMGLIDEAADGDRLGKTIIFAKNQVHAEFIVERFNANYPHYQGEFARVITFKTEYAQSLIDSFSNKEKAPHIAISVDMLDTGIDIPEVVNLVFFKLVRSKTKFWQMLGRGTRLCPDLFGPGKDKEFFYLFDYCQNLEYFSQDLPATEGAVAESLAQRLFRTRLELIAGLDQREEKGAAAVVKQPPVRYGDPKTEGEVRRAVAERLQGEVAAMNVQNFVVRPHRRLVEKYARAEAWTALSQEALTELSDEVAGLPSELEPENEEAKRFDLLVLNLQLCLLRHEPGFDRLRDRVKEIAGLLEEKSAIPMVREHMALIQDVQTDTWWQDVTIPMLEVLRRRLRDLIQLIDKRQRIPVYSNFEDLMGPEREVDLPGLSVGTDYAKFRAKAQAFLRAHLDHVAIHKLRTNKPLTTSDLAELERMLAESGLGEDEDIRRAADESQGLGLFVRSLVGMDRGAAKEAMAGFISGKTLAANQIEFIDLIINHLTEHGMVEPRALYESPFTDLTPRGPDVIFTPAQIDELMKVLEAVRATALAA
ncbi:MAG: type I restriction-modification enzyme R subunit C-terminal domain-containing protein [Acidobacteriota bacterium]